jgi:hypothetical protein
MANYSQVGRGMNQQGERGLTELSRTLICQHCRSAELKDEQLKLLRFAWSWRPVAVLNSTAGFESALRLSPEVDNPQ